MKTSIKQRLVKYDGLTRIGRTNIHNSTAKEILSHKLEVCGYEKEARVFTNGKQFVEVTVKEILLGRSVSTQDFGLLKI